MAIASNFPAIKPSLLLDFANTKRLDSRVTFTRTTTATYYDGVTTAMAEQNLLLQSQDFSTTWLAARVTVSANTGDTTAPDGTNTADKITNDNVNDSHIVYQPLTLNGKAFTFSVFAKKGTADFVLLRASDGTTTRMVWFNLNTGAVATTETNITASIVNVGNGWYRCIGTWSASTSSSANYSIGIAEADNSFNYVGTNKDIYLWGAQLEQRSSVTSYTATTTQAITNYIPVLLTAASGVARLDHNPTTDEPPELLIEEARTNLATYSADFSNASWVKAASSITSNTIVAPDGTLTGDKLVEDTANNNHTVRQPITVTSGTTYTFSCFIKAGERTECAVEIFTGATVYRAVFNLLTGAFISSTGTGSYNVSSVGNGWFRISITAAASTTTLNPFIYTSSGGTTTYTGNGYNGIYIWGAQLEAGAFATSYIATTSATVTRNADAASMTDSNFTSWFNNAEGTLYAEAAAGSFTTSPVYAMLHDGTSNNYIILQNNTSGSGRSAGAVSGVSWTNAITANTASVNVSGRYASVYKVSDQAICLNNGTVATSTNGTLPVVNQLKIGDWRTTGNSINGRIKKIAYYPLRLTNAQLQALTS